MLKAQPVVVIARVLGIDAEKLARCVSVVLSRNLLIGEDVVQLTTLGVPITKYACVTLNTNDRAFHMDLREGFPVSLFWNMLLLIEKDFTPEYERLHALDLLESFKPPTPNPK